jgi:hypothetical protein
MDCLVSPRIGLGVGETCSTSSGVGARVGIPLSLAETPRGIIGTTHPTPSLLSVRPRRQTLAQVARRV